MALFGGHFGAKLNQAQLPFLNRQNFSFPPDHGARIVTNHPVERRIPCAAGLDGRTRDIRNTILGLPHPTRKRASASVWLGPPWLSFAEHRGMFSRPWEPRLKWSTSCAKTHGI